MFDSACDFLYLFGWPVAGGGTNNGELYEPFGVAVDSNNSIVTCEQIEARMQKFGQYAKYE